MSSSSIKEFVKLKAESLTVKRGLEVLTGLILLVLGLSLMGLGTYVFFGAALGEKLPIDTIGAKKASNLVMNLLILGFLPFFIGLTLIIASGFEFYGKHRPEEKVLETAMKRSTRPLNK
jgi:hypothetical protein